MNNINIINNGCRDIKNEITSYLKLDELSILGCVSKGENVFAQEKGGSAEERKLKGLVPMCNSLPARRALQHYRRHADDPDPIVLNNYKWLVVRDIPFKTILSTILAATTINVAFLYINKILTGAVIASIISSLLNAVPFFISYMLGVGALNYFNISKDELVHLALAVIPIVAFYALIEVPRVIVQLFKSSVYTAVYFLFLHGVTACALIGFNICKNPLFKAFGLLMISLCLFSNMANSF